MFEELQTLVDVLSHPGFQIGFITGLVGAILLFVLALILRRPVPGWGLVFAVAVGVGLMVQRNFELTSFGSLVLLAASGLFVDLVYLSARSRIGDIAKGLVWLVVAVGVVWFSLLNEIADPSWVRFAFPLTVLALGVGVWWLGRLPASGLVGPLVAISIAGVWVTVAETDDFTVMLGVALPLALVTLRPMQAQAWATGAFVLAGLFALLVLGGGEVRPWTMLASWATIAPLPVIASLVGFRPQGLSAWAVLAVHFIYVAVITRVADYTESALVVFFALVVLISLVAATLWFAPQSSPDAQPAS
ncbi:MAG: hypothetical protein ACLFRT_11650 [Actinomycetota bacterium]